MNNVFLAVFGLVMFGLGSLITFGVMSQKNEQNAQINSQITSQAKNISTAQNTLPATAASSTISPTAVLAQAAQNKGFNTQQVSQEQAKQLVNSLPDSQLNDYMAKFIPAKDSELITDKRQFANRAIDELYKQNDIQPLQGQILLSTSSQIPTQSMDTSTVSKRQKIFAHLDTFGKVSLGANVFIKWVNRDTGEVLLFEKKLIQPNSDTNWVSYQPYDSWQTGNYDIRFYQFTSQLQPVAQLSYSINQIIE